MDQRRTRILLVEDDPADALLVQRNLGSPSQADVVFSIHRAATLAAGLERLEEGDIDAVLLDLHLPDSQGVATVQRLRQADSFVPIVVFTVAGEDEMALAALHAGAQDYLVKSELSEPTLRRAIRYAMERQRLRRKADQLSERLRHTQKLESLGVLAGGIAHDFNNLLTVILANAALAQRDLPERDAARSPLNAVIEAARFASRLTDQLLAYSGGADARLEPLDLSDRIAEIERLLLNLMPDSVVIEFRLSPDLPAIAADASQMQQLAMNFVKNAAEAMADEGDGRIQLETGILQLDPATAARMVSGTEIEAGPAVYLSVRDAGCGMDPETAEKIFDPFFTTKLTGRGLGLAACHGIVRSHRGALRVESRPGQGTRVTAYFPLANPRAWKGRPGNPDEQATILVVDDDDAVREVGQLCLERFGYRVREAAGGHEAIECVRALPDSIDLVLLDLTMPDVDGAETFLALREIRPQLPVLLTSGYDPGNVASRFVSEGVSGFLRKPYEPDELAEKVTEILDRVAAELASPSDDVRAS